MYTLLIVCLCALSLGLIVSGLTNGRWPLIAGGIFVGLASGLFFWFLDFWTEFLWFSALGYGQRFWTVILTQFLGGLLAGVVALLLMTLLTRHAHKSHPWATKVAWLVSFYLGFLWANRLWDEILLYVHGVETELTDPILHHSIGFYLFSLPFYNDLQALLMALSVVAIGTHIVVAFLDVRDKPPSWPVISNTIVNQPYFNGFFVGTACLLLVLAGGVYLERCNLMYSTAGAVMGPGWTDVHIRLPAYALMGFCLTLFAVVLGIAPIRQRLARGLTRRFGLYGMGDLSLLGLAVVALIGLRVVALDAAPALFQWLRVQPNEITVEEPYIAHNIDFTRRAFALERIEEREFSVSNQFDQALVDNNQRTLDNIRLWDWRALDSVYQQFQEIRLYYEFTDVDVDRYHYNGRYHQVMISAREMRLSNLPASSQTFVNQRFKYTHGNGITLTPVNEFVQGGLPNLLIKDIPPTSRYDELNVTQPRIYYGELTHSPVIVNTEVEEFDYPRGENNVYTRYSGTGGVRLHNRWRQFLFGWRFDGTRLFFAQYPTADSRILFDRNVTQRVRKLAPFLRFDDDPYIVLAQGQLYWIIDGYTVSTDYPYSEPMGTLNTGQVYQQRARSMSTRSGSGGVNYIRNAVKAVVNAYDGTVDFYVYEPNDPLIRTWQRAFPDLFRDRQDMPEALRAHVRYPSDLLRIQGHVYAKYHMTNPAVFYNQEDLWVPATEKYYSQVQEVTPYYIMWEPPGSDTLEFVLMHPFTPKNRQVLIGWIAGMCDPDNYGRLLAFKFPKEKRVLGTQQVETKIDQDSVLSARLSLWDQRGSRVIRGNVLAIPIENTLLYVEPIYLQAETAAYPELRLVALMHNDQLSYAETFDEALQGLLGQASAEPSLTTTTPTGDDQTMQALVREAGESFERYLTLQSRRQFDQAAEEISRLSDTLERMAQRTGALDANDVPEQENSRNNRQ